MSSKGRKERVVPLWKSTAGHLRDWLTQIDRNATSPVFPSRAGKRLSRSGVEDRIHVAVTKAAKRCLSLVGRRISPHTFRHTTAMHLLQSGVDPSVIALWLGHEDLATTHLYVEADLAMKEAALQRVQAPSQRRVRYRASDPLLAFLSSL
ncbi:MAG: tyrosine-type recombinase/integrase [Acidobacteriota bacterium]